MSATAIQPASETLTAEHRCDRCGAQAYVRTRMPGDLELLWCAHHWREHGEALRLAALEVHDETHRLT